MFLSGRKNNRSGLVSASFANCWCMYVSQALQPKQSSLEMHVEKEELGALAVPKVKS